MFGDATQRKTGSEFGWGEWRKVSKQWNGDICWWLTIDEERKKRMGLTWNWVPPFSSSASILRDSCSYSHSCSCSYSCSTLNQIFWKFP